MIEAAHRLGSRMRHTALLERHPGLLAPIEPAWRAMFGRLTSHRGFVARVNGESFRLTYDYASRYDRSGTYEPGFYRAFTERIGPGMTVLDIGAHVGFFAIGAARRVGPRGKVYAFEPAPETAALLERHIYLNGYRDRVEVVRAVVCDKPGSVPFYARGASMAASMSRYNTETLSPEQSPAPTVKIETPSTTIDQFCAERDIAPGVVKLDVEGAELRALQGAEDLMRRGRGEVLCEIHPEEMAGCGASLDALNAQLGHMNCRLDPLDDPNALGIFHALVVAERY
jgi:FkbM family methyltransferase